MYLSNNMQLQGGKYKICKILGQGGFGITYLAIQSCLERYVAIKEFFIKELCSRDNSTSYVTLGTESCKETVDRFRGKFIKEARKIAKLNHPNIIRIKMYLKRMEQPIMLWNIAEVVLLLKK